MTKFRMFIGALVSVAVVVCAVGCASTTSATTASAHSHAIPAGQLGGPFTSDSVASAERVLASDGIATVADEKSTTPLTSVTGTVRVTFTEAQVRAMTLQAADGGGITGAALDSAATVPSGDPPFAYLLASWIKNLKTRGATAIRKVMGTQNWTDAPTIVFPSIALPLFTADVIDALPASPASSPSALGSSTPGTTQSTSSVDEASYVRTGILSSLCSTVSNFVQGVLNSVFAALQFSNPSTGGIGGFFKTVWNGAISLAQQAVQGVISAITGPVLNAIKTVAAAATVVAQIASYLNPWSIKVTADPATVNAGSGGTLTAAVDTGTGDTDYPAALKDCATAPPLSLTLPPLTAADSKAKWDLTGAISTSDDTSVTLDEHGESDLSFTSSTSDSGSAGCDAGPADDRVGTAKITVTRSGVDSLKQLASAIVTNGLGIAGSIIGPVINSILSPILDQVIAKLSGIVDVTGAGHVAVTEPTSGSSCAASPDPTKSAEPAAACMVGTWRTLNESSGVSPGISGQAGIIWTISKQGLVSLDYNNSTPLVTPYGSGSITGTQSEQITPPDPSAKSGGWNARGISNNIRMDGAPPQIGGFEDSGSWTCSGDAMTVNLSGDGGDAIFTMTRVSN